jgi:RNA polymerase sigma-70 factor (ECF subfamily)
LVKPVSTLGGPRADQNPDPDLYTAITGLPDHHKDVVVARNLLDMSEEATAQAFGIPKGTVKSRLSRALATLKEELS